MYTCIYTTIQVEIATLRTELAEKTRVINDSSILTLQTENTQLHNIISQLQHSLIEKGQNYDLLYTKYTTEKSEYETTLTELTQTQSNIHNNIQHTIQEAQQQLNNITNERDSLISELEICKQYADSDQKGYNYDRVKYTEQIKSQNMSIINLQEQHNTYEYTILTLKNEITSLQDQVKNIQNKYNIQINDIQQLTDNYNSIENELYHNKTLLNNIQSQYNFLQVTYDNLTHEYTNLKTSTSLKETEGMNLIGNLTTQQAEFTQYIADSERIQHLLREEISRNSDTYTTELTTQQQAYTTLQTTCDEQAQQILSLQSEVASIHIRHQETLSAVHIEWNTEVEQQAVKLRDKQSEIDRLNTQLLTYTSTHSDDIDHQTNTINSLHVSLFSSCISHYTLLTHLNR